MIPVKFLVFLASLKSDKIIVKTLENNSESLGYLDILLLSRILYFLVVLVLVMMFVHGTLDISLLLKVLKSGHLRFFLLFLVI